MQTRSLGGLTAVVTVMVAIDAIGIFGVMVTALAAPDWYNQSIMPMSDTVDGMVLIVKFATMIVFAMWIYAAGRTLVGAGVDDCEFTPGSRVWWFFIPFANLVKPFQGMRELWNASHGIEDYRASAGFVTAWWVLWLLVGFTSYVANAMIKNGAVEGLWALSILMLIRAAIVIPMLWSIVRALGNRSPETLDEVFA